MGTTYDGKGDILNYTNDTGAAISVDDVLVLQDMLAIALVSLAAGATGSVTIAGKHNLDATAAEAWPFLAPLFWNTSTSKLTADPAAGYPPAGRAAAAKAAAATTAGVLLNNSAAGGASVSALSAQEPVLDTLDFTAAEPAAPTVGDRYINTGAGASSETAQTVAANEILEWNGTDWTRTTAAAGMFLWETDAGELEVFTTSWIELPVLNQAANVDAHGAATYADPAAITMAIPDALTAPAAGGGSGADGTTYSGAQCDALRADVAELHDETTKAFADITAIRTALLAAGDDVGTLITKVNDEIAALKAADLQASS